ncbi:MAG: nucleotidyltransferase [Cytophagaceae bacterium]|nr:nucleotidyltransferase [Cytophagaceae bacterium]|tara:strand:- start:25512 stop:27425 length:1914 start_codon:yes stop_codon:yes gene_type:complete
MSQNTIAARIYDFLKRYPPFTFMDAADIQEIADQVKVIYLEKESVLFKAGELDKGLFYIVKDGAIKITREQPDLQIVDMCDEGDLVGLGPLIVNEDYKLSAIANEESIVYGIPIPLLLPLALHDKKVSNYLITSFASNVKDPYSLEDSGKLFTEYIKENTQDVHDLQKIKYSRDALICGPKTKVQKAAKMMGEKKVGSIIIAKDDKPVGIITNRDLRDNIATGKFSIDAPVEKIMSHPVKCFQAGPTVAQAQLIMLKNNINHLCITEDGTPDTKILGIITQHDVIVAFGNNPVVLMKEIKRAKKVKDLREIRQKAESLLKKYLDQNLPLSEILNILNEINYAICARIIELALKKLNSPPCNFAWLSLGSQGRKEQLLLTDQDNAIVFEDVPEEKYEPVKAYFLALAKEVTKGLHKIGYEYCPADMMASNPNWCQSLTEWKKQYTHWITNPTPESILLSTIFFDYSYLYSDTLLVTKLSDSILEVLADGSKFFNHLAKEAVKSKSPMGFFRQFLVEPDGEHKDFFDIKSRAMMPLIDAARVLSLQHKIRNVNNTAGRFEKLALLEENNKEIYESCAYAFKALLKFRTRQGILHNDSGRFIELATLNKSEKLKLKRCFKPIRDVQEILAVRFQFVQAVM